MKPNCISINSLNFSIVPHRNPLSVSFPVHRLASPSSISIQFISSKPTPFLPIWCSNPTRQSNSIDGVSSNSAEVVELDDGNEKLSVEVGNPIVPSVFKSWTQLSFSDQAFFLLSFIACTTSIAFTSLVIAAVPTLYAMGRAAASLSKLADAAREELPSTMAAIRLSGMEIGDLTLELSDLSQEIADGVNKSAQAVQAAEAGIRQFGALAHQHTVSMIQERANLPTISLQPVVTGAAKKTSRAIGRATKSWMNFISGGEARWDDEEDSGIDRLEI